MGPTAKSLRVLTVLLIVAGWASVLWGLYVRPVSREPEFDLDAGGRFAMSFAVYLPAMALTFLLLVTLPVALFARVGPAVALVAATATICFGYWGLAQHALLGFRPGVAANLWIDVVLGAFALVSAVCAWAASARPARIEQVGDRFT